MRKLTYSDMAGMYLILGLALVISSTILFFNRLIEYNWAIALLIGGLAAFFLFMRFQSKAIDEKFPEWEKERLNTNAKAKDERIQEIQEALRREGLSKAPPLSQASVETQTEQK
ncbi:MAG: hypothetical protein SA339_08370 [Methanomassiliicoccus sp.]|nr:hypothetical protein [Methanomassiliicoccus sp.]